MASEKRLIDANALKEKLQEHHDFFVNAWGGFSNLPQKDKARVDEITSCIADVANAPTVDAVEVVRCKDCCYRKKDDVGRNYCGLGDFYCGDTDYCSRGQKQRVNLQDIVDLDAQTAKNNESMRKVIDFIFGGTDNEDNP